MTEVMAKSPKRASTPKKKPVVATPPAGPLRAQKKLDKRARIRAAAWDLFTTVGFDETRTKDVAKRAGIATGTLFLYAEDKNDLLCLVMHDRLLEASDGAFLTLPKKAPLVDQLLHVFRAVFAMYAEHPKVSLAFVRVFQGAEGPNGREVGAMTFAFLHRLSGLVHDAIGRGEVAVDTSPMLAAQAMFALYFFAVTTFLSGYTSMEAAVDPLLRSGLELFMRGLTPRR